MMAIMFCIMSVKIYEIIMWYDEMVQFDEYSLGVWINVRDEIDDHMKACLLRTIRNIYEEENFDVGGDDPPKVPIFYLQEEENMKENAHEE